MTGWEWVLAVIVALIVLFLVVNAPSAIRYMKIKRM
jgi:hypothetical protein